MRKTPSYLLCCRVRFLMSLPSAASSALWPGWWRALTRGLKMRLTWRQPPSGTGGNSSTTSELWMTSVPWSQSPASRAHVGGQGFLSFVTSLCSASRAHVGGQVFKFCYLILLSACYKWFCKRFTAFQFWIIIIIIIICISYIVPNPTRLAQST